MFKRKFKLALLAAIVSATCCAVHAQDMIVRIGGTETLRIAQDELRKLAFSEGNLIIEKISGEQLPPLPLADVMLVFVDENGNGLPSIVANGNLQIHQEAGILYVTNDQPIGRIQLLSTQGVVIAAQYSAAQTASLNVSGLPYYIT